MMKFVYGVNYEDTCRKQSDALATQRDVIKNLEDKIRDLERISAQVDQRGDIIEIEASRTEIERLKSKLSVADDRVYRLQEQLRQEMRDGVNSRENLKFSRERAERDVSELTSKLNARDAEFASARKEWKSIVDGWIEQLRKAMVENDDIRRKLNALRFPPVESSIHTSFDTVRHAFKVILANVVGQDWHVIDEAMLRASLNCLDQVEEMHLRTSDELALARRESETLRGELERVRIGMSELIRTEASLREQLEQSETQYQELLDYLNNDNRNFSVKNFCLNETADSREKYVTYLKDVISIHLSEIDSLKKKVSCLEAQVSK